MKLKGSAIIAVLMISSIILFLSTALVDLLNIFVTNAYREEIRWKLYWIVEGKFTEIRNLIENGPFIIDSLREMKYNGKEVIERVWTETNGNFPYPVKYYLGISITNGIYSITLKGKSKTLEYSRTASYGFLDPFSFLFVFIPPTTIPLKNIKETTYWYGYILSYSNLILTTSRNDTEKFVYILPKYMRFPTFFSLSDVYLQGPLHIGIGNYEILKDFKTVNFYPERDLEIENFVEGIHYQKIKFAGEFWDINNLYYYLLRYAKENWIIKDFSPFFRTRYIVNPFTLEKTLIGIGDGQHSEFTYIPKELKISRIYYYPISEEVERNKIIPEPLEALDAYGSVYPKEFFEAKEGKLKLLTKPFEIILPLNAMEELNVIKLAGDNWSIVSKYNPIKAFYIEVPDEAHRLNLGEDIKYIPTQKRVIIISERVRDKIYSFLGDGNGFTKVFRCGKEPKCIFVGGKKVGEDGWEYRQGFVYFKEPPQYGQKVYALLDPPKLYVQKGLPEQGIGIFTDKIEKVVELNLSELYNLPDNGIIISHKPLYIYGNALKPVLIYSLENVYLGNINADSLEPKPVFIISTKGVWSYSLLPTDEQVLYNVYIYTPLDGLYRVSEVEIEGQEEVGKTTLVGSLFILGKYKNKLINISLDPNAKNFVFTFQNPYVNNTYIYMSLGVYRWEPPFLFFPPFVKLLSLYRY